MTEPTWKHESSNRRSQAVTFLRLASGLIILAVVLCFVDVRQFVRTLGSLDPYVLVLLLGTAMVGRFIRAWKWNSLLRVRGIRISTWQAIRLSLISHFVGAWTPGQLGADAYRVIALRPYGKTEVVLSTVLIERYAGLCAVSFFSLISMPVTLPYLYREVPWVLAISLSAIVLVAAVVPCLFSKWFTSLTVQWIPGLKSSALGQKIRRFHGTCMEYRQYKGTLIIFGFATLVEVLSYFTLNYLAARSLGLDVTLTFFLFAMPIVHLMLRIPISFQSIGVQEGCFVYSLVIHGFSAAEGLAMSIVQRTLEWVVAIVPGALLLWLTSGPSPLDDAIDVPTAMNRSLVR